MTRSPNAAGRRLRGVGGGLLDAGDVKPGVGHRVVEVVEDVVLVGEAIESTDGTQDPEMLRAWSLEEHRDVTALEFGDDLAERLGAGGVEDLDIGQSQDHDPDVADRRQLGQEPLGAPKNSAPSNR